MFIFIYKQYLETFAFLIPRILKLFAHYWHKIDPCDKCKKTKKIRRCNSYTHYIFFILFLYKVLIYFIGFRI